MALRNIVVIGASAGGFEALKKLAAGLPKDLEASLFIVWHMSPDIRGVLPQVLNRADTVYAAHAHDGESIKTNRIYVAPPDRHLVIEEGRIRVTRGPKENRFRPAVDPLFRSAAYVYGRRVIGVVLSGALDDGTAGLWQIKNRGGLAIVQDPHDAEVPSMPENALREVAVDYSVPISEMPDLLVKLSSEQVAETSEIVMEETAENKKTEIEIRIAAHDNAFEMGVMKLGHLTPFTCPECHGVLLSLKDGTRARFRCHTGHAFSADALLTAVTENIEDSLWSAIRGVEESVMLLNHLGDHFAELNQTKLAALYFQKAREAEGRTEFVRKAVRLHEQLSKDSLFQEVEESNGNKQSQNIEEG
jgi:two-component system chemotaxis response regulator CheB